MWHSLGQRPLQRLLITALQVLQAIEEVDVERGARYGFGESTPVRVELYYIFKSPYKKCVLTPWLTP